MQRQTSLPFGNGWGGLRIGAGRKPAHGRAGVPHVRRAAHSRHQPIHVTVRVRTGLPSLREQALFLRIRRQIGAAKQRFFRIMHFSVQSNHMHLLIEASDRGRLSSGMKGLGVRVVRALNGLLGTRGTIWDDRYHARALKTPREVRNALVYVLFNHRKHGRTEVIDACSSARYFDGWAHSPTSGRPGALAEARGSPDDLPVVPSETWLLGHGWKRLGLLGRHERPA